MKPQQHLGFLGFLGFLGIPELLTQDFVGMLWLLWFVWFIYFIPKNKLPKPKYLAIIILLILILSTSIIILTYYQRQNSISDEIIEKSLTPQECIEVGGRTLNIVGGQTCEEYETNIGKVVGFISPNICCLEINSFKDCINAGYPAMESYPLQCNDGKKTWTEQVCLNQCGNGICEKVVCLAEGCPCAETRESCAEDC